MKTYKIIITALSFALVAMISACSDFEELNQNPREVNTGDVRGEYFLNKSIIDAQQDPHIAERIFILIWRPAAHFERASGFAVGRDNNEWITDYYGISYGSGWVNNANLAVSIGEEHIANGQALPHTSNVVQMARIWRAYLYAELACGFGPIAIDGEYRGEKEVFDYVLSELKEAVAALDPAVDMSAAVNSDAFFGGDVTKWKKYGNSLRMRYAMLLSVVDNAKAKAEFEDAAKGDKILSKGDIAAIAEQDGWNALAGVMSRTWNTQQISVTFNNLVVGLGGQAVDVPNDLQTALKNPQEYLGVKLAAHFPSKTNDPCAGYYFDGLPSKIDPRATKLFNIPGYNDGKVYFDDGSGLAETVKFLPMAGTGTKDTVEVTTKYSWSAWVAGSWDTITAYSGDLINNARNYPRISNVYRTSTNKRVWFGPWETNFLLAEAAVYGWSVGGTAQSFYEAGIRASFEYMEVSNKVDAYLASTDYNRVGTSVRFDHTTEATNHTIGYLNGYTGKSETTTYQYPKNSIYKGGASNNDLLTKIITQKYLAFVPWQPQEAWNDHRRLGLPFMENQATEIAYAPDQVPLTPAIAKECRLEFYPKRYRYPANIGIVNPEGYAKVLELLGGADMTTTPLWWNMK